MSRVGAHSESRRPDPPGDRERVEQAVRDLRAGTDVSKRADFLFHRFSGPLERQFIRWGVDLEEAHDLSQEAFKRIFQSVESFQGGPRLFESWVAWMWQIARTTWLRSERSKRALKRPQNPRPLDDLAERVQAAGRPPGPLDQVLNREALEMVRNAVDELPDQEFKCVILYYYQGRKTREIAVILKIAPGTVKAHLSHARAKLKKRLGEYFEYEPKLGSEGESRV